MLLILCVLSTATPANAAAGPPADAHEHLRQVLDRPLFKAWRDRQEARNADADNADEKPLIDEAFFERYFGWVGDFFDWLFRSPPRNPTAAPPNTASALPGILRAAAWTVLAAGTAAVLFFVVRALVQAKPATTAARVLSRAQIRDAMESGDALALGAADWMDEAGRLAAEQDFRAVYRALYLALLSGLHASGKIEHRRTRTNWAYVDRYRGPDAEKQTFGDLTAVFDRTWYGRRTADAADLPRLRDQVSALTRAGA